MVAQPMFPIKVWDGLSERTERTSIEVDQWPNHQDWNQIVAEVRSVEKELLDSESLVAYATLTVEEIEEGDIVSVRTDGYLEKASSEFGVVSGISKTSAPLGGFVIFAGSGRLSISSWSLIPGELYFLNGTGQMDITPPTTGWVVQLGRAVSNDIFDLNIQQPIRL